VVIVDLAGSERLARSGAEGARKAEAAAINKSLAALGDCVAALGAKAAHVPYRNSALTRLLEAPLRAGARTLMVACVAPEAASRGETLCPLASSLVPEVTITSCTPKPRTTPSTKLSSINSKPKQAPTPFTPLTTWPKPWWV
jgi:hypothetical protein